LNLGGFNWSTPEKIARKSGLRRARRKRNAEVRAREYLTDGEIARLIDAAGRNRYGHRDATMVLVAYRHGLRAGELVTLRWDAIDFAHGRLHVSRLKGSSESVHPSGGSRRSMVCSAIPRLSRCQIPRMCGADF
jgi:integrase